MLGPQHSILRGLREPGSETELTRVLGAVFKDDPRFAADFVKTVLLHSKRGHDPRWAGLPDAFSCIAEVQIGSGERVDLEFRDLRSGWRVLVELKIGAGYGFDQIERYLRCLDEEDERHILVAITRDVPKYGDPPLTRSPNWAGSLSWSSVFGDLRSLQPTDHQLAPQWTLLLDVLEDEGSMGVTRVDPGLLLTWARSAPARKHAVAFMEVLRQPLLAALREALASAFSDFLPEARADVAAAPTDGRKPQVDVWFHVPAGGELRLAAQLWAWEDFRFVVSARYPSDDGSDVAKQAIAFLSRAGFDNYKNQWLWRSRPLDAELLSREDVQDVLLEWARESFDVIAASGLFSLNVEPLAPDEETVG